jgi:hypothetical protein
MTNDVVIHDQQPVRQNPLAMVADAVQKGTDPATIKALMDLAERYEANEARKAFTIALNAFKADAPKIIKTKEVSFGAGKTAYKHALAGAASEQIGAALAAHGISHRWDTSQGDGGIIKVTCILTHAMGHSERVTLQATPDTSGSKNSIQAIGSTVSYLQRYTLFAATGLVPMDADDDGQGGKGKEMPESAKKEWLTKIESCADMPAAETLWGEIAKAATAAGDIPAYDELKAAMVAKRKALKTKPAEPMI